jgi:hypothetical protein
MTRMMSRVDIRPDEETEWAIWNLIISMIMLMILVTILNKSVIPLDDWERSPFKLDFIIFLIEIKHLTLNDIICNLRGHLFSERVVGIIFVNSGRAKIILWEIMHLGWETYPILHRKKIVFVECIGGRLFRVEKVVVPQFIVDGVVDVFDLFC